VPPPARQRGAGRAAIRPGRRHVARPLRRSPAPATFTHRDRRRVVGGRAAGVNAPDYLLLGNATGGFTPMPIPETTVGAGDRAHPVDYTKDGLTAFLVLNGQVPHSGPIQLLTPPRQRSGGPGRSPLRTAPRRDRAGTATFS
jgi:hypothetical protein